MEKFITILSYNTHTHIHIRLKKNINPHKLIYHLINNIFPIFRLIEIKFN